MTKDTHARSAPAVLVPLIRRLPQRVLLAGIRVYQSTIGPALPRSCRFEPSCSMYAFQAVERYGAFKGSWLALERLMRCQPFGGHGYDPLR